MSKASVEDFVRALLEAVENEYQFAEDTIDIRAASMLRAVIFSASSVVGIKL